MTGSNVGKHKQNYYYVVHVDIDDVFKIHLKLYINYILSKTHFYKYLFIIQGSG